MKNNLKLTYSLSCFFIFVYTRIVSAYLVHHGYCATAETFANSTGQSIAEELSSIRNRQRGFYFRNITLTILPLP